MKTSNNATLVIPCKPHLQHETAKADINFASFIHKLIESIFVMFLTLKLFIQKHLSFTSDMKL